MFDKFENIILEDTHGVLLLYESADHKEPMDTEDHGDHTTDEALGSLGCGDKDIFEDDPLTASQLVAVVEASTLVDSAVPPRDPETAKALEPQNIGSWVQNVLEESGLD